MPARKIPVEEQLKLFKEQVKYLQKTVKSLESQVGKKPAHRPYLFDDDDFKQIEAICSLPCIKETEVADIMGVSVDTLCKGIKRKYGMTYAEYRNKRLANFRFEIGHTQRKILLKGNTTMSIWLGKQYLGQSDKTELSNGKGEGGQIAEPFKLIIHPAVRRNEPT